MSQQIYSWVDGHLAVRERAYEMRGFCELEGGSRWPRTTGADVIAIAALVDPAIKRHGTPGVVRRWKLSLVELAKDALPAPHETFVHNRSFWPTFEAVAIFLDDVAVAPPEPAIWDALLASFYALRNVGPDGDGPFKHFDNVQTYADLYAAQHKYLRELRGYDNKDPEPGMFGPNRWIPRTTNHEVVLLAEYWGKQLDDVKEVFGRKGIEALWKTAMVDVDAIARKGDANALYTKNNGFWRALFEVAVHVSVADEAPSKWDMAVDSVKDSVKKLPETLKKAAGKAADAVGTAAHTVGKVVNEAGRGLFSGLGAPILIGAGLLGVFIITRRRKDDEQET